MKRVAPTDTPEEENAKRASASKKKAGYLWYKSLTEDYLSKSIHKNHKLYHLEESTSLGRKCKDLWELTEPRDSAVMEALDTPSEKLMTDYISSKTVIKWTLLYGLGLSTSMGLGYLYASHTKVPKLMTYEKYQSSCIFVSSVLLYNTVLFFIWLELNEDII